MAYRVSAILLCASIVSLLTSAAVASPPPPATPTPLSSFSAGGWVSLRAVAREKVATMQAEIEFAHSGSLTRVDLGNLSVSANNGSGDVNEPLPAGTISAVVDQTRGLFLVWSSLRPLYYESKSTMSAWSLTNVFNEMSSLTKYQVISFSLNLLGHQMVDGHMASVFELDSKVQKQGGKIQNTVGHVAFADDLSGLPIHEDFTIGAGEPSTVAVQADLTRISTSAPPASAFAAPRGYAKTSQLLQVLMTLMPSPPAKRKP